MIPGHRRNDFADNYSSFILFSTLATHGSSHVCTVHAKLGVPCNDTLVHHLPANCTRKTCPWVCDDEGHCQADDAYTNVTAAAIETADIIHRIQVLKAVENARPNQKQQKNLYPPPCRTGGPKMKQLCDRLTTLLEILGNVTQETAQQQSYL